MPEPSHPRVAGSPSIGLDDYWWYVARSRLLAEVLAEYAAGAHRSLDVGSADAPSAGWLSSPGHVTLDIDPRGLTVGGVCGSALALPFRDEAFDVVSAFDVIEHVEPEAAVLAELTRVLRPGGHLLLAVPAYDWAWTGHDHDNGHLRRYTRPRLRAAMEGAGLEVRRATYLFSGTFPAFAAERLLRRVRERGRRRGREPASREVPAVPALPAPVERALLALTGLDARLLRRHDLPFGSSVAAAGRKR